MPVQLIMLRADRPEDEGVKGKRKHRFTKPPIEAENHKELFEKIEEFIAKIDEKDRWNIYYTVPNCAPGKIREMLSQDIMAFDVDGVNKDRIDDYLPIVADTLALPEDTITVVESGNGLHFLVQLTFQYQRDDIPALQPHYKEIIKRMEQACKNAGLTGKFDMILDSGRILRLPLTENRKPGKPTTQCRIRQCFFVPQPLDIKKLSGLPDVAPEDAIPAKDFSRLYPKVDNKTVLAECQFLRWVRENPTEVKEPQGYAALSILSRFEDGPQVAKNIAATWTNSSSIASWDLDQKIEQALAASGPRTCKNLDVIGDKCKGCPHQGKVISPIAIQGPDFIPTEGTGFHEMRIGENGQVRYIPRPHDLQKFLVKEAPYKVVSRKMLYRWTGKKYELAHELFLRGYGEQHYDPKPTRSVLDEFVDVVQRYNHATTEWFTDSATGLANFENGMLDTRTGVFFDHKPEFGFRTVLPFNFEPGAGAPTWERFLESLFPGDKDTQTFVEEFFGYALSGDRPWEQKVLMEVGEGSNGKSTLNTVLQKMAGREAFSTVKVDKFNDPESVQQLDGKLFNISGETPRRGFDESAGLKELVGGDFVTARKLWVGQYSFRNTAKIIFSCNEIPRTLDNTHGFYRRFWVVKFNQTFSVESGTADKLIDEKLEAELSGIYNRVRAAYSTAKARGSFTEGASLKAAVDEMREEMDTVGTWIKDNLRFEPGSGKRLKNSSLYSEFVKDMEANGHRALLPAYSIERVSKRLRLIFPQAKQFRTNTARGLEDLVWVGPDRQY